MNNNALPQLNDLYSVDQSGQVNNYVVQKNKWKHFENKYINKFQLTTTEYTEPQTQNP
jgi:hypothetical protein